jgi:hypothetical protein
MLETKVNIHNKLTEEHTINLIFSPGCPLSSTLFKTDMIEMIVKWKQIYTIGIILAITTKINILHFAGDQVIIVDTEDKLRRRVFKF